MVYGGDESRLYSFGWRRLDTICKFLGKKRFREATAQVTEKWDKKFAELGEQKRNLKPCKKCGRQRDWEEEIHFPEGLCHRCIPKDEKIEKEVVSKVTRIDIPSARMEEIMKRGEEIAEIKKNLQFDD